MFRDECELEVRGGKGGDGLCSFRREKYVARGGPDGGDGGDGGGVVLVADERHRSLLAVGRSPLYRAGDGRPGGPGRKSGARGADLEVGVPPGTEVRDLERGNLLADLARPLDRVVIARGGRGGRGNAAFTTSVRQAPRRADPGGSGETRRVRLVLKLFAEVGLVGLPNAGKSTFLSVVSRAHPRIAAYPFTTLVPEVGIAAVSELDTLVLADLPGLIEGASRGAGLGIRFLRHVERCRVLLHLVDVGPAASVPPEDAWRILSEELSSYSAALASRPRLLAASKCESREAEEAAAELERATGVPVHRLSSATGRGVPELLRAAWEHVKGRPAP